jgi:hypothetical protein
MKKDSNYMKSFATPRKKQNAKEMFLQILGYISVCYDKQLASGVTYSKKVIKESTYHGDKVENALNVKLAKFCEENKSLLPFNFGVAFEYHREYQDLNGNTKLDRIDIAFLNLGLGFVEITDEEIYFAIECKRVNKMNFDTQKPKSNISEYVIETDKFLESRNYKHRFPFEGMVGYVESIAEQSIPEMIDEIHTELAVKTTTTQNLQKFYLPNSDFKYCHLSKHTKNDENKTNKEIYHLFLDYSTMVVA